MTDATPPIDTDTGATVTPAPATDAPQTQHKELVDQINSNPTPAPSPSAEPPTPSPGPEPTPAADSYKIPDAYKDKPWAAKIKSEDDLFKQIDNLTTLVGKKTVVPDLTKATDAEREEYYALTRPASIDAYDFGEMVDPAIKSGMGASLLKNGVSAIQANAIIKDYQASEQTLLAEQFNPDGIKQTMEKAFGSDWQNITGQSRNAIKGLISSEDDTMLDNLPNAYIGLVYRIMGNVVKSYGIKEGSAHTNADGGGHKAPDVATTRTSLRNQIAGLKHRPHTVQEKQSLVDQLNATYEGKA